MGGQTSMIEIGFDNRLAAAYFSKILGSFRPDLVHFFHFNRLGTGTISRANELRVPAFFTPTDFWTICPTGQLLNGDGSACSGPSLGAGNCILHFAGNELGGRLGKMIWRLPKAAGRLLGQFARMRAVSRLGLAREVTALSARLDLSVRRLNRLNAIVAPNREIQQLMLRFGVRPERLMVVPYGVDVGGLNSGSQRRWPSAPIRLGFIGTLGHHKGCHVLLEAFRTLPRGQATLKVFGSERDFPEYAARLRGLADGVSGVEFCGTFPNEAIGAILHDLDALVVPSVWTENTPLVVYSAQAARCPVIGSDVPGIAAAVRDNVDGIIFEAGNAAALASVLLRASAEPELLARLSAACEAPKSIGTYVDELTQIWEERHSWRADECSGMAGPT